ncbi:MAG: gamma carbonic anhydrase family protein [Pseudomonadota bacterium]
MIYALDGKRPVFEGQGQWVAPNAHVIGDVTMQAEASVWFGTVVRGDVERITIGARSNIQDQCVLHADVGIPLTIGGDVTVGHQAMLHGCTIGDGCLIGIGATVLNHAVIGKQSLVGAHALVTEGKQFPDGVLLMGAPAKVVRELTDVERQALAASAAHYVANAHRFRDGLEPLG